MGLEIKKEVLLDRDCGEMWQIGLAIESQEVVDLLLALELGGDLCSSNRSHLDGAAVNLGFFLDDFQRPIIMLRLVDVDLVENSLSFPPLFRIQHHGVLDHFPEEGVNLLEELLVDF